jgi:hypothetical protein
MVVAFAAGLLLARRYAPALAATQTGRISARVVEILVGASAAVLALNVYTLVRNVSDSAGVGLDAEVFAFIATDALWQTGLLVAAAAAVHLLAPPPDEA